MKERYALPFTGGPGSGHLQQPRRRIHSRDLAAMVRGEQGGIPGSAPEVKHTLAGPDRGAFDDGAGGREELLRSGFVVADSPIGHLFPGLAAVPHGRLPTVMKQHRIATVLNARRTTLPRPRILEMLAHACHAGTETWTVAWQAIAMRDFEAGSPPLPLCR